MSPIEKESCISFDSYIKPQLMPLSNIVRSRCISFDSYIKPQLRVDYQLFIRVVYLLIPTSNHNSRPLAYGGAPVVYLLIPTSNHNTVIRLQRLQTLYIFWFLHQTTTGWLHWKLVHSCISFDSYIKPQLGSEWLGLASCCISFDSYIKPQLIMLKLKVLMRCISFDSYIKPQHLLWLILILRCCISFDSYIKPQPYLLPALLSNVVYLLIPTSNHNNTQGVLARLGLYIFWFLHQTTTIGRFRLLPNCCISFDSYIKPQLRNYPRETTAGCISFDSYIKPQPRVCLPTMPSVVYLLIPTSNHNSLLSRSRHRIVVYLLIPTSNHNI